MINVLWKMKKKVHVLCDSLPTEIKSIQSYIHSLEDMISGYGFEIIDYTGKKYNSGQNVEILSVEGTKGDNYTVLDCLRPTIIFCDTIIQKATVIIKRGE